MPEYDIPLVLSRIPAAAKAIEVVTHLAQDAFIDSKTALLNEAALSVLSEEYSATGVKASLAVVFLDLLDFKHVNSTLGYIGGDAALKAVATEILELVKGETADCFRQHGDEFVIFLPAEEAELLVRLGEERLSSIPVEYQGRKITCRVTIGYCIGEPGLSVEALIKRDQDACVRAKETGSRSAVVWDSAIDREEIEDDRRRCEVCFATTTLLVRVSQRRPESLTSCANCGASFGALSR